MKKYHDSGTICTADKNACPLGENTSHIEASTQEEFERKLAEKYNNFKPLKKTNSAKYKTKFNLISNVNDLNAAQEYLSRNDMTQYLPDNLKEKVENIQWKLTSDNDGEIIVTTNNELTDNESQQLSEWISGQNSDGLGEGFEQQDFAWAEEDCYCDEDYCECEDYGTMASFDWTTNPYKLKKQ